MSTAFCSFWDLFRRVAACIQKRGKGRLLRRSVEEKQEAERLKSRDCQARKGWVVNKGGRRSELADDIERKRPRAADNHQGIHLLDSS